MGIRAQASHLLEAERRNHCSVLLRLCFRVIFRVQQHRRRMSFSCLPSHPPCYPVAGPNKESSTFWMSSTQWGRMMAAGDEGAVAGTVGQTKGTADTLLWASYSGIRAWGSHLQSREAPRPHSVHLRLRFRVNYQSAAASSPYEFFLFALPPTQEMGCSHTGGSQWPAGAGSGGQSAVAEPRWPAASERALAGY